MHPFRLIIVVAAGLLALSVLGGCGSTEKSTAETTGQTKQLFSYDSRLYHVEVEQLDRNGRCVQRNVLFTSYSRLYIEPYVSRVRAVDQACDATYVSDFEDFEIMRAPEQRNRYESNLSFRRQVDEDLWDAYQDALFDAETQRRRARAE